MKWEQQMYTVKDPVYSVQSKAAGAAVHCTVYIRKNQVQPPRSRRSSPKLVIVSIFFILHAFHYHLFFISSWLSPNWHIRLPGFAICSNQNRNETNKLKQTIKKQSYIDNFFCSLLQDNFGIQRIQGDDRIEYHRHTFNIILTATLLISLTGGHSFGFSFYFTISSNFLFFLTAEKDSLLQNSSTFSLLAAATAIMHTATLLLLFAPNIIIYDYKRDQGWNRRGKGKKVESSNRK